MRYEAPNRQAVYSQDILDKINNDINTLIIKAVMPVDIGTAYNPIPCEIDDFDSHAIEKLKERGITLEDAQEYIDTAVIMFEQDGYRNLYLCKEGGSVLISNSGKLITAYSKDNFKKHTREILMVVSNYENT